VAEAQEWFAAIDAMLLLVHGQSYKTQEEVRALAGPRLLRRPLCRRVVGSGAAGRVR
jgi:hypothetical protein